MSYRQNMPPRCGMPSGQTSACPSCARPMADIPQRSSECGCEQNWPVAMAYVPVQAFQSTYDLNRALEVGTIFPELHKPFCGKRCMR